MTGLLGTVTVPRQVGRARLAYITPGEAEHLRRANVGGVNPQRRTYHGPAGVPRLDAGGGDGGGGSDGGGSGGADSAGGGGMGGSGDVASGSGGDASNGGAGSNASSNNSAEAGPDANSAAGMEQGQTGGAGFGASSATGPMGQAGFDTSATAGLSFGPAGQIATDPVGATPSARGLDPGLAGIPGLAGPAAPGTTVADASNAPSSGGFSLGGLAASALGLGASIGLRTDRQHCCNRSIGLAGDNA